MRASEWIINLSPFQITISIVVKNAAKQYNKLKKKRYDLKEGEIASTLYNIRYAKAKLSRKSEMRWMKYMETEFEIKNMVDFCLSSIDIEFLVDPRNELHNMVGSKVVDGLEKKGVPVKIGDVKDFQNRWFMANLVT